MLGFLPRMPAEVTTRSAIAKLRFAPSARPVLYPWRWTKSPAPETYEAISQPAGDLVVNGRVAKFLIDWRDRQLPRVHFVNGNFLEDGETPDSARYHYFFARSALDIPESLGEFNDVTYFTQDKRYVAGVVHTYLLDGSTEPVYGLQFYPQDVIAEETVVAAVSQVKEQITLPQARFAFVPTGSQQTTATVTDALTAACIDVLTLDQILGSIQYLPLNTGEAWGTLRIFPPDNDELRPTDIPVFEELPLDLSVVAGVFTKAVQDTNSHVNLKSKERNTPNAVLRNAGPDNPRLAPFADQPVHLVVSGDDFLIEPTTDEIVAAEAGRTDGQAADQAPLAPGGQAALVRRTGRHHHLANTDLRHALRLEGHQPRLPGPSAGAGPGGRPGQPERRGGL